MTPLTAGTALGAYTVEGVIGQGAMAIVYRVRHRTLRTTHALKVPWSQNRALEARALREGRLQASIRHPNVVPVTDVINVNGAPGLIMDYIDGWSLEEHIDEGRLTREQIDPFVRAILAGVASAHDRGFIHRDLKPSNVMLECVGDDLVPRVTDFGLAKDLDGDDDDDGSATRPNTPMGTPAYMAPEQIFDAKAADTRADVFSLGAMIYELLAGQKAFQGRNISDIYDAISAGRYEPLRPDQAPAQWREAVRRALAMNRDDRPTDAGALLALLGEPPRRTLARSAIPARDATPARSVIARVPSIPSWAPDAGSVLAFALGILTVAAILIPAVLCLGFALSASPAIPAYAAASIETHP